MVSFVHNINTNLFVLEISVYCSFDLSALITEENIFLMVNSNCSQLSSPACGGCSNMFRCGDFPFILNTVKNS